MWQNWLVLQMWHIFPGYSRKPEGISANEYRNYETYDTENCNDFHENYVCRETKPNPKSLKTCMKTKIRVG